MLHLAQLHVISAKKIAESEKKEKQAAAKAARTARRGSAPASTTTTTTKYVVSHGQIKTVQPRASVANITVAAAEISSPQRRRWGFLRGNGVPKPEEKSYSEFRKERDGASAQLQAIMRGKLQRVRSNVGKEASLEACQEKQADQDGSGIEAPPHDSAGNVEGSSLKAATDVETPDDERPSTFVVGDRVFGEEDGNWYAATVTGVSPADENDEEGYDVEYDGFEGIDGTGGVDTPLEELAPARDFEGPFATRQADTWEAVGRALPETVLLSSVKVIYLKTDSPTHEPVASMASENNTNKSKASSVAIIEPPDDLLIAEAVDVAKERSSGDIGGMGALITIADQGSEGSSLGADMVAAADGETARRNNDASAVESDEISFGPVTQVEAAVEGVLNQVTSSMVVSVLEEQRLSAFAEKLAAIGVNTLDDLAAIDEVILRTA